MPIIQLASIGTQMTEAFAGLDRIREILDTPREDADPNRTGTLPDLKGTVDAVFKDVLGSDVKLRFRPHYFSYTEPSLEIDFTNALVKKLGKDWLEIAGCGMVHPQVFENVGYDPEVWTGWAFGFGIERIAMLRYGITDIRLFYENDARFLRQF